MAQAKPIQIGNSKYTIVDMFDNEDGTKTLIVKVIDSTVGGNLVEAIKRFQDKKRLQYPSFSSVMNASIDDAIDEINKLIKKGETQEMIIKCLDIAVEDTFWNRNLMVLTTIGKKCNDGLTKYEHLKLRLDAIEKKNQKPDAKASGQRQYDEI